jgi:hypothetical protein
MYRYLPVRQYVLLALGWRMQMSKNMKIVGWLCLVGCAVVILLKIITFGPAAVLGSLFLFGQLIKVTVEHYNS